MTTGVVYTLGTILVIGKQSYYLSASFLLNIPREHNMIRYVDGEPTGIFYSEHGDGRAYSWDDPKLLTSGGRVSASFFSLLLPLYHSNTLVQPWVYSAYGSHANYAVAG